MVNETVLYDSRPLEINAEIDGSINYASWQNSVPLLKSLTVSNPTTDAIENVILEAKASPKFLRPKRWNIDRLRPGDTLELRDRDLQIDPEYLDRLNEAERGIVTFELRTGEKVLATSEYETRVLARDEWGGLSSNGELLAAYVMPNDSAISKLIKITGDVLAQHGHSPSLDGYQSGDPGRAYLLAAATWSAVASKQLTYANPPKSFEQVGQKTRLPSKLLDDGLATCLDSTLLFASTLEAVGLNPVVVMVEGHCFAGVWLIDKTLDRVVESDCTEIRKAIASKELITFETTLVTHRPPARFEDAVQSAAKATSESKEDEFRCVIDIARARMTQIRPLASYAPATKSADTEPEEAGLLPLPAMPDLGDMAAFDLEVETMPTSSDGRIDRWQRKLLDLSLRNKLLNFKTTKQTVPIVCTEIGSLEDQLAAGKKLRLISLSEHNPIGERDAELHRTKTNNDFDLEFSRKALTERGELACSITEQDLGKRLTALYRSVRNDLAEGGSNTLFLAVGFLKWKRPEDSRTYRAPLLLVPVKLNRKSAVSEFHLWMHEDEVRFNATLIQFLKRDFARDLRCFEGELPTDDRGIDVPKVLRQMRQEVRDIPGFEVVEETALGTFSFSKYLMWKDLVDRIDSLQENRVVKHLVCDPDKPFHDGGSPIPTPFEMDTRYAPQDIVHPLPADSSQLAAVMAASEGKDFVLIGPPGTGKSQTIANIIAQCLAVGKTVLFVAEKTAALDVVYRRLKQHGLGNCCLELHSNKAERRKFLDQMDAAWTNNRKVRANDWLTISEWLKIRRDELNRYVWTIHKQHQNGWTAYKAMGTCVRGQGVSTPSFNWDRQVRHDQSAFNSLAETVKELGLHFNEMGSDGAMPFVRATDWSVAWEAELLRHGESLRKSTTELRSVLGTFSKHIGLESKTDLAFAELDVLHRLARKLAKSAEKNVQILFHKDFSRLPDASEQLRRSIDGIHNANRALKADYSADLEKIPLDAIEIEWRRAISGFWPLSWFAKRKVTRFLRTFAKSGVADPATDVDLIRELLEHRTKLSSNPLSDQVQIWKGLETDVEKLDELLGVANDLRQALKATGQQFGDTNRISKAIHPFINGRQPNAGVFQAGAKFLQIASQFLENYKAFCGVAGSKLFGNDSVDIIQTVLNTTQEIDRRKKSLKRWVAWCGVQKKAETAGLGQFTTALEEGELVPSELPKRFELAYARWWISMIIDEDDVLRKFQGYSHEEAIRDFKALDDQAREAASNRVLQAVAHDLPAKDGVPRKSDLGLLRHQIGLTRPSKSIREVISNMPDAFGKLAPCLLMSPLSIAQYLPVGQALFDVVVFDEASQITTWDAVGAIARGRQTIIVGDPKQLPPTNFFGRTEDDSENDEIEDHDKDLESILDEAQASGLPVLQLNWHYRSRHESLIAFSNWNYYGNELVTFPAAEIDDRGVSFVHSPNAKYDRGKSRTNRDEAAAIVKDAVERMLAGLELPEDQRMTFGVITFNVQQQSLIQDFLDQAQVENPGLDWYFSDERIEPTAVKNLENVQGDERDVMYFSITFGRDVPGKAIPLNFGALNRSGGERRLNVAVTRARQQLIVYSSFKAEELNAEGTKSRGVKDLKAFLEYAEKGPEAILARIEGSVGGYDSPFEEAVADRLASKGWQVVPQVGVSGFRIDLGIVHPDKPGSYLAGVECDGATYHRSAVARDRDKTRQQVLELLGWNILRLWSPDWWYDSDAATEALDLALQNLLSRSRSK